MSPQPFWALLLFWVDPGEDRKRADCCRYRNLSPFRALCKGWL